MTIVIVGAVLYVVFGYTLVYALNRINLGREPLPPEENGRVQPLPGRSSAGSGSIPPSSVSGEPLH
jgi:hypothetical protein